MKSLRAFCYVMGGHVFLVVGLIGVILPVLPTTPFVLLACFCYERGSPRFHALLLENRYLGPYIRNWRAHGSIPLRGKVIAVFMISLSIGWIVYAAPLIFVKVMMAGIGIGVSLYVLTRPTSNSSDSSH